MENSIKNMRAQQILNKLAHAPLANRPVQAFLHLFIKHNCYLLMHPHLLERVVRYLTADLRSADRYISLMKQVCGRLILKNTTTTEKLIPKAIN